MIGPRELGPMLMSMCWAQEVRDLGLSYWKTVGSSMFFKKSCPTREDLLPTWDKKDRRDYVGRV